MWCVLPNLAQILSRRYRWSTSNAFVRFCLLETICGCSRICCRCTQPQNSGRQVTVMHKVREVGMIEWPAKDVLDSPLVLTVCELRRPWCGLLARLVTNRNTIRQSEQSVVTRTVVFCSDSSRIHDVDKIQKALSRSVVHRCLRGRCRRLLLVRSQCHARSRHLAAGQTVPHRSRVGCANHGGQRGLGHHPVSIAKHLYGSATGASTETLERSVHIRDGACDHRRPGVSHGGLAEERIHRFAKLQSAFAKNQTGSHHQGGQYRRFVEPHVQQQSTGHQFDEPVYGLRIVQPNGFSSTEMRICQNHSQWRGLGCVHSHRDHPRAVTEARVW